MEMKVPAIILCLSVLQYLCGGQPCTTLTATKPLLVEFAEIPVTDNIRRGEVVFNREQAKFNVSEDYGFLVDEAQSRLKTLIEGWISKGLLGGSDAQNVWRAFNRTLSEKAKGSFFSEMSNPGYGTWNAYQFISARTTSDRVSAAYAFLILKHKDDRVSITSAESNDLSSFVKYKNRKNFNERLAGELARFAAKHDGCRS
uniref:Secreted protein n=1 Tax=Romanomermis culicivorax TaxID=13658 RepID=A0A915J4L2_ROMCU